MKKKIPILVMLLSSLLECRASNVTLLYLSIDGKAGVIDPYSFDLAVKVDGETLDAVFSLDGEIIKLPTSIVIRADNREGQISISIKARDKNQRIIGEGEGNSQLTQGEQTKLTVQLMPTDFELNARHQASQLFSTAASGRQLAVDNKGNFVAVWEDDCAQENCDIWYRMFDELGIPKINSTSNTSEELKVNENISRHDAPSIAMQSDGRFVVTFFRFGAQSSTEEVLSRAFDPNGTPNGQEILISQSGAVAGAPHIAVLSDKNYIVVWHQYEKSPSAWKIFGRILGSLGQPISAHDGKNEPMELASFPYGSNSSVKPLPAVAGGKDNGFMVVWRNDKALWGKCFGPLGAPASQQPFLISDSDVQEFHISKTVTGYAVIWSDRTNCAPDDDGSCIRLQNFQLDGTVADPAWVLNTSFEGSQSNPAITMRTSDGALLAVWSTDFDDPNDPAGGIRGRKLLDFGLPVGSEFIVNSTKPGVQGNPAVAPRDSDGFIVIFRDQSQLGDDKDGASIRGRLIYPDYAQEDGNIGAVCDEDHPCREGMSCVSVSSQASTRCLVNCTEANSSCASGGICSQLNDDRLICLFANP